jgi:hypothetical protein
LEKVKYKEILDQKTIDDQIESFNSCISDAIDKSIPKIPISSYKYPFSEKIKRLSQERNWYRNEYRKTEFFFYKTQMNRLNKLIKAESTLINQEKWVSKLESLKCNDNSLYNFAGKIKNKIKAIPPLVNEIKETAISSVEKANFLAKHFLNVHKTNINLTSPHDIAVSTSINTITNGQINYADCQDLTNINNIFSSIKNLKNKKAPGYDGISNKIIKQFSKSTIIYIVKLFNNCYKIGYFPNAWKIGKVIPIPKANKNLNCPKSYRPITLLSNVGKLFESQILLKILQFVEDERILINQQFGFRKCHSTTHQILRITERVSRNFNQDNSTGMVFLDIEKAFDTVWHDGLIHKLVVNHFPEHLIKIISSFLKNREAYVNVQNEASLKFKIPAGLPQGAVLSPHLFNFFINDIPIPKNCNIAIYADDTSLYSKIGAHGLDILINNLENGLNEITNFFSSWKIKINPNKTEAIIFSHSRIINKEKINKKIWFKGEYLEWKNETVYLGVKLDKKLFFKANIEHNILKAKKALNILYPLLKKLTQS